MTPQQKWQSMMLSLKRAKQIEIQQEKAVTIIPAEFLEMVLAPKEDVSPSGVLHLFRGADMSERLYTFLTVHWESFKSVAHIDEHKKLWRRKDWDAHYANIIERRKEQEENQRANAILREEIAELSVKLRRVYGFGKELSEQVAYTFLTDKTGEHKRAYELALTMHKHRYEQTNTTESKPTQN